MERKNGRAHGEVFTGHEVIQFILDEVGYKASANLKNISILEPSAGHGAFGIEILSRLWASSRVYHFSFEEALLNNVRLNELSTPIYEKLKARLANVLKDMGSCDGEIAQRICTNTDFLENTCEIKYDCIVGNPPYIRHELIPDKDKLLYRSKFGTFRGRADIYIPFFEHALKSLRINGSLSFICANRWLYNQYGEPLRELIAKHYDLRRILNIEKASPFDEVVSAYPCITTISNAASQGFMYYCETDAKQIEFEKLNFRRIPAPDTSSWQNLFLEYDIHHDSLLGIKEQGFKIGIGVATGADSVFIIKKESKQRIEKNRLLPLIMARDLSNDKVSWKGHYVINPYENGRLCDLANYPDLCSYLSENKTILLERHIARKAPERWYQTIDKISPELLKEAKILLPDLTGNKWIFIDQGQFYPHHNIYYITGRPVNDLKILTTLLMSDFVRQQLSQIGIRMNGGLPRFQAQALKKLKVPNINRMNEDEKNQLVGAYDSFNIDSINTWVNEYCERQGVFKDTPHMPNKHESPLKLRLF